MFEVMSSREDLHDRSSLYCISSSLSAGICRIKQGLGMEVHPVSINTTQTLVKDIR